jgi:mannose-1-phosphate guanylyltransferase/mannose-6-phosphate isomerase
MIYPVILAGGSGTRLWPLSRELYPKQLLQLTGDRTMLQDTLLRLRTMPGVGDPIVICNENHRFMVAEQLRAIGVEAETIILEPMGRNTAPAVALAAIWARSTGEDPRLLVLPADHFIREQDALHDALEIGAAFADARHLITFGIVPEGPETGYGYIQKGNSITAPGRNGETVTAAAIRRFVEKPDLETARSYLASGEYCWNSGMFMFRASEALAEMETHAPDIVSACRNALAGGRADLDFFRLDPAVFEACPSDSIDYAVMERTEKGAMVPLRAGWNDLGSWEALWQVGDKNGEANVVRGDVLLHDVRDSYLHAASRLVAAVGLSSHIVVETADAVLIAPRDRVQEVKRIVEQLKERRRDETVTHKTAFSPWGTSETLVVSERFRVNRVTVKPGAMVSLQKHFNRAEHWIVVRGTALVHRGDEETILQEDSSTYIPPGVAHRLTNPGKIPLEVIEVQSGSYLGQDDIDRLEETYAP